MPGRYSGKVALVTGAATGIGRASALAFAKEGAKVVVADLNVSGGEETVNLIKQSGGESVFIRTDVSKAEDVQALIQKTVDVYGRLDCAHNNAGIDGIKARLVNCPEEVFDRVINVNLKGVWLCMKYQILQMLKTQSGAIVNTSSIAGIVGLSHFSAYAGSKHGIIGLTKTAALENMKFGIRINAICPGPIDTEMIDRAIIGNPLEAHSNQGSPIKQMAQAAHQYVGRMILARNQPARRLGRPEEVAQAVLWLCSDAASFVTGYAMPVDGGYTVR